MSGRDENIRLLEAYFTAMSAGQWDVVEDIGFAFLVGELGFGGEGLGPVRLDQLNGCRLSRVI